MRIPILRFASIVTCLVLCSAPYQVQALSHGFLYSGGSFTPIDVPGARATQANGINAGGQIVGLYSTPGALPELHGFLESGASFTSIDVPGAGATQAFGINAGAKSWDTITMPQRLASPNPPPSSSSPSVSADWDGGDRSSKPTKETVSSYPLTATQARQISLPQPWSLEKKSHSRRTASTNTDARLGM
jgi:hypothetical protein